MGQEQPLVEVRKLIDELGVDGACRTAEEYFAQLEPSILSKPFNNINETPELLSCFAQVLQGLKLFPGLVVLDFGSGSCWTSRFLTQLGLQVIALDVSATALRIGRELYDRQPVFGDQPEPMFLHFDGRRIEISDGSVDRILCFDALHHTPNPGDCIAELGRVLRPAALPDSPSLAPSTLNFSSRRPKCACTGQWKMIFALKKFGGSRSHPVSLT